MKKNKLNKIIPLYISYIFQLPTIVVISVSFVLMTFLFVMIANPWMSNIDYVADYVNAHENYLTMSLFMIQLFNSVIIATIVITIGVSSNGFDALFISGNNRKIICISKLIAIVTVMLLISAIEFVLYFAVALFRFSLFKLDYKYLLLLLYLFLSVIFEAILSILITTLIQNNFIPMLVLFASTGVKLVSTSVPSFKKIVTVFLPYISVSNMAFEFNALISVIVVSIISIVFYITIYNIKDIKV